MGTMIQTSMTPTGIGTSTFGDELPDGTHYAAAVFWRGSNPAVYHSMDGDGSMIATRARPAVPSPLRRMWNRLREIHFPWRRDEVWSSTSDGLGRRKTEYSQRLKKVRIQGRQFSLPTDGRMLV